MRVLIFGASGMVGSGALRESLLASDVTSVRTIGRSKLPLNHAKLEQLVRPGFAEDDQAIPDADLTGIDACYFCIGVTASGMAEAQYLAATFFPPVRIAQRLSRLSPQCVFVYVSGAGADSTEKSSTMWARVRGKTENTLLQLPLAGVYAFRPSVIQPLHGAISKTASYRNFYRVVGPFLTILRKVFPGTVLSTEVIGKAMLAVTRRGVGRQVLEARDIYEAQR